jgi:hypothetical protein
MFLRPVAAFGNDNGNGNGNDKLDSGSGSGWVKGLPPPIQKRATVTISAPSTFIIFLLLRSTGLTLPR